MQRKYNRHGTIISARTSVCHEKVSKNSLETALSINTWILPESLLTNCKEVKSFQSCK